MKTKKILYINRLPNNTNIIVYNFYKEKNGKKEILILNTNKGFLYSNHYITKIIKKNIKKDIKVNTPYIFTFQKVFDLYQSDNNKTKTSIIANISFYKSLNIDFYTYNKEIIVYTFFEEQDKLFIRTNYGDFICNKYIRYIIENNNLTIKNNYPYIFKFNIIESNNETTLNNKGIRIIFNIVFYNLPIKLDIEKQLITKNIIKKLYTIDNNTKVYVESFIKNITNKKSIYILNTNIGKLYSNEFISPFLENNIINFDFDGNKYYKKEHNNIFDFIKITNGYILNRKKIAIIGFISFNSNFMIKKINNNIDIKYTDRSLKSINHLEKYKNYIITKIIKYVSNDKNKYILMVNDIFYKSNIYFEEIMDNYNEDFYKEEKLEINFKITKNKKILIDY